MRHIQFDMSPELLQRTHGTEAVQRNITKQLRYSLKLLGADPATLKLLESPPPLDPEVINEIYAKLESLGADPYLLASVGSWGDTLDAEEVLEKIKDWNLAERERLALPDGPFASHSPSLLRWKSPATTMFPTGRRWDRRLLIATCLIVAIRTARWPTTHDPATSNMELEKEIGYA